MTRRVEVFDERFARLRSEGVLPAYDHARVKYAGKVDMAGWAAEVFGLNPTAALNLATFGQRVDAACKVCDDPGHEVNDCPEVPF